MAWSYQRPWAPLPIELPRRSRGETRRSHPHAPPPPHPRLLPSLCLFPRGMELIPRMGRLSGASTTPRKAVPMLSRRLVPGTAGFAGATRCPIHMVVETRNGKNAQEMRHPETKSQNQSDRKEQDQNIYEGRGFGMTCNFVSIDAWCHSNVDNYASHGRPHCLAD